jgi:hypothetical protein
MARPDPDKVADRTDEDPQKMLVLLVFLVVAAVMLSGYLWYQSERDAAEAERAKARYADVEQGVPEPETASAQRIESERSAEPSASGALMRSDTLDFSVGISANGFKPVEFQIGARSTPLNVPLSRGRPAALRREPAYEGSEQWYGVLTLGSPVREFPFALDLLPNGKFAIWFDADANGDLTDDGAPLTNKGSGDGGPGGFATTLRVAWRTLSAEAPFDGEFSIWFYSNKSGWARDHRASHYSRTQLKGKVAVGRDVYVAWIADSGYNDADLTNDGMWVDLNANGKADKDEWYADVRARGRRAAGARGRVEVRW